MLGEPLRVDIARRHRRQRSRRAISSSASTAAISRSRRWSRRPTRRGSPRWSTTRPSSASPASTSAAARPRSPIFADGQFVHVDALRHRRPSRDAGHRARPFRQARRCRAAEDAARLGVIAHRERRTRHRLRRSGRRGRACPHHVPRSTHRPASSARASRKSSKWSRDRLHGVRLRRTGRAGGSS